MKILYRDAWILSCCCSGGRGSSSIIGITIPDPLRESFKSLHIMYNNIGVVAWWIIFWKFLIRSFMDGNEYPIVVLNRTYVFALKD